MKSRSIHKNLDTSFVNLSSLIKYLRKRQFVGSVYVQLNGYQADILLKDDNTLHVREHDQISGRVSEGETALQRVLIRSREPGGSIDVIQVVKEIEVNGKPPIAHDGAKNAAVITKPASAPVVKTKFPQQAEPLAVQVAPVAKNRNRTEARFANPGGVAKPIRKQKEVPVQKAKLSVVKPATTITPVVERETAQPSLPDFPFKLSNKFERKAREKMSAEDWQKILRLTVELLTIVDRSLAAANLNFSAEFRKICADISDDYPFLNASSEVFFYSQGKLAMKTQISEKIFVSGVTEALRTVLIKLSKSEKYAEIYKLTAHRLQTIIEKRSPFYQKYGITPQVRRIVSP